MSFDVIIVGAGPGGLACAESAASLGLRTLILESKQTIGKKVCAGGITWNGLMKKAPDTPQEKQFCTQHIYSRFQNIQVTSKTPIISTVNREKLGQQMAKKARQAGVEIRSGCRVTAIDTKTISYYDQITKKKYIEGFSYLVGADGSTSIVRRYLGLTTLALGVGINYQIPGDIADMQWHLNSSLFSSGYSWVFPHSDTVSVGAYVDSRVLKAKILKSNLIKWGEQSGFPLSTFKPSAEFINFDFRGWRFGNIFLIGDAAGLASALTGEGIYPAIISGEAVAKCINDPLYKPHELDKLIKNHSKHRKMVSFAGKNRTISTILSELVSFGLKTKIVDFRAIEMAR